MKSVTLWLCSILCISTLQAQQTDNAATWLSQTDSMYNFTFNYPDSWTLKLPGTNTRFFVTSKTESDNDMFRENVNCMVRTMEQKNFVISDAADAIKKSLAEKLKNFVMIRSEYITWNNTKTLLVDYTCTQEANEQTYDIHILQYISVVKGTLFTFTYTAEQGSYASYLSTAKKIFMSIRVR